MICSKSQGREMFFPRATDEEWNDWKWQMSNRIETIEELGSYMKIRKEEIDAGTRLRMAITPYYLSLINPENVEDPIRKQAVPTVYENDFSSAHTHKQKGGSAVALPPFDLKNGYSRPLP